MALTFRWQQELGCTAPQWMRKAPAVVFGWLSRTGGSTGGFAGLRYEPVVLGSHSLLWPCCQNATRWAWQKFKGRSGDAARLAEVMPRGAVLGSVGLQNSHLDVGLCEVCDSSGVRGVWFKRRAAVIHVVVLHGGYHCCMKASMRAGSDVEGSGLVLSW